MGKLTNRVALVTGAGRGIGRAIVLAFAAEGANVALSARTAKELDDAVAAIRAAGGKATAFTADLSDRAAAPKLTAAVAQQLGPIDILVNNAGVGSSSDPKPLVNFSDDFWDLSMQVNVTAPYQLCKAVLPSMISRRWGRIITVASINSRRPSLHGVAYAASKHAVLGLSRTAALETAGTGVTVNCICPGPVKTLMNDRRVQYDVERLHADMAAYEKTLTPIGGRLVPEDIAPMAVYLASEDARMITGQAFNVDGGIDMA